MHACMYVFIYTTCAQMPVESGVHQMPLELEFQVIVSCHLGVEN